MNFAENRSAKLTITGRRPTNQDSVVDVHFPDGSHLIAVADGMGGHQSGEVASTLAISVLKREIGVGRPLGEALQIANATVHEAAASDPSQAGMGTTMVALLRRGTTYQIANVGDSRAYRVERSSIRRITSDHSFAAEAARTKVMSLEEIARSPWRNALTRSLGTESSVEVDLFGPFDVNESPHVVLLCSDGVYRGVSDDAMRQLVLAFDDVAVAAEALTTHALKNGSDDNMSVVLVEFGNLITRPMPHATRPRVAERRETIPETSGRAAGARTAMPAAIPVQPTPSRSGQVASSAVQTGFGGTDSPWLRRLSALVANDNALFGLSVVILLLWLLSHLTAGS